MQTYIIVKLLKVFEKNNWTGFFAIFTISFFTVCNGKNSIRGKKDRQNCATFKKEKKMCFGLINFVLQFLQRHLKGKM